MVLHVEPEARLIDVVVRPHLSTGVLTVSAAVSNAALARAGDAEAPMGVSVLVSEDITGVHVAEARQPVEADGSGEGQPGALLELQVPLEELRPWDLDDPFLYRVRVRLEPRGSGEGDEKTVRTGFRDLRVRNGWFELNGRRIYLRSTHTGNHYPIGQVVPQNPALVRQDLVYAKASGFNTVRFIAGVAREDQLDFCDELGLMVYEETRAAWLLGNSPRMAERFDRTNDEMVRRDRNHPSVVIWGLLNETYDGPVFRHAVEYLHRLRALDDSRLVLLGSGRWDGDLAIGSVCNPGQSTWAHEWGSEQAGAGAVEVGWAHDPDRGAFVPGAGDLHLYPTLPESVRAKQLLRTMGAGSKPVFLSEYGVGSLFDAVTVLAEATRHLASDPGTASGAEPPDVAYVRSMVERYLDDWERFGMGEVYCFPEDALVDSQLNQSVHRAATFDMIRANGNIAGYNLTGMLDHALTGEGPWTFWRRWKPSAMDTTADGWSALRWCLDVAPALSFPGGQIELDLSLANEDVLSPGRYTASVAIVGPERWRWTAVGRDRGPKWWASRRPRSHRARHNPRGTWPLPVCRVSGERRGTRSRSVRHRGNRPSSSFETTTARWSAGLWRGLVELARGPRGRHGCRGRSPDRRRISARRPCGRARRRSLARPERSGRPWGHSGGPEPVGTHRARPNVGRVTPRGAGFLHQLSRLALPQGMLRQTPRLCRRLAGAGSYALAVLR